MRRCLQPPRKTMEKAYKCCRKLRRTLTELSYQLGWLTSSFFGVSLAVSPPPAAFELSDFRGFQDDSEEWVPTVNALGDREAWTDQKKWCMAINRLWNAAAAWHRYEGAEAVLGRRERQAHSCFWTESPLPLHDHPVLRRATTTEDGAQEETNLEAAAVLCSLPRASFTTCPIPPHLINQVHVSRSRTLHL